MRIGRRREPSTAAAVRSDAFAELDRGAAILEATPWSGWRRFESEIRARSYTPPAWMPGWMSIAPDTVSAYCAASTRPARVAALLSMHPNGYVRERAVEVLADSSDPLVVPALILRSTDWVRQVRDAAASRLRELQTNLNAGSFLTALPMLEPPRWSVRARGEILDVLRRWVLDELPTDQLIGALRDADWHVRRAAAQALAARGEAGRAVHVALAQSDPATATMIAESMSRADWEQPGVIEAALDSKFSRVSGVALAWLQANAPDRAIEASISSLSSRSSTTRFLAQHFLRSHGVDSSEIYRTLLASTPAVALTGLGEAGSRGDAKVIEPYLEAAQPACRAAALTALARLVGRDVESQLCEMLADPTARVARSASWALIRLGPSAATVERAWKLTIQNPTASTRNATFRLFGSCGRWAALALACRGIGSGDSDLDARTRALLENTLSTWNRSFTSPTSRERSDLETLISPALRRLDEHTADRLLFSVKPHLDVAAPAHAEGQPG